VRSVIERVVGSPAGGVRSVAFLGALLLCGCTGSAAPAGPSSTPAPSEAPSTAPALTGQIAFAGAAAPDRRRTQIYLERADGSSVRQVVHSGASDTNPALSPDGRRLVFTRHVDSEPDRIYTVDTDGSGLTRVAPSNCPQVCSDAVEGSPWSPDGRMLVFTRSVLHRGSTKPSTVAVWLTNTDGSGAHALTHPAAGTPDLPGAQDGSASWAPDGRRVLFTRSTRAVPPNPDQFAVYSIEPDGADLRQLTPNDIEAGHAVWSPDGTLIVFQSPPDHEAFPKVLFTVRADGSGMTELTENLDGNDSDDASWAPDSSRIVFSHVPPGSSRGADLYVVDVRGGPPRPIAVTDLSESAPSWGAGSS
jgi:TolB protein